MDRALQLLKAIGDSYELFDEDLTFEDVKARLIGEKLIRRDPERLCADPARRAVHPHGDPEPDLHEPEARGLRRSPDPASRGGASERTAETRPYRFGDDCADIDFVGLLQERSPPAEHETA